MLRPEGKFMVRLLAILLLMVPAPVEAGAWLRDKGKGFWALSATGFKTDAGEYKYKSSAYFEYGALTWLTVGLDAEEHQDLYGHALIFARFPVKDFGNAGRLAAEFGVGAYHKRDKAWALYKTTLSYGKGFQSGWGNGWAAVDTALEYRSHEKLARKLDFTVGVTSERWLDPLLQIETTHVSDKPFYWSVRPSVMIRPKFSETIWVLGLERNSARRGTGLKFAVWRAF